jgi:hypothetical protein
MPRDEKQAGRDEPAPDAEAAEPSPEDREAAARRRERELFSRLARVRQYPLSPDEDVPPPSPGDPA